MDGKIHTDIYPNILWFGIDPKASLWKLRSSANLLECFRIPMTRQAYNEFLALQDELLFLSGDSVDEKDVWPFIWGQQIYSSNKFYQYQFQNVHRERSVV
jgi:hypothetical protein